jgi:hypothetical protein
MDDKIPIDVTLIIGIMGGRKKCAERLGVKYSRLQSWVNRGDIPYPHRVKIWKEMRKIHLGSFQLLFPDLASAQKNDAVISQLQELINNLNAISTSSAPNT